MLEEYPITGRRATEIAASVETALAEGSLRPGQLLPPLRELATALDVNPNTVAAAYRTLRERGVVHTAGRRGTRVRERPASVAREAMWAKLPEGVRDLSSGNPDPALLPPLAEALAEAGRAHARRPVRYGDDPVEPEFADHVRRALTADGVRADSLAVTSGSLDGVERVCAAHLRPGDAVAVEDPGWGSLLDLVPALGLRAVPVAVDDEGPLPEEAERALAEGVRAWVVTARAQNPTGAGLSATRAERLRRLLGEHPDTLLIEDDHGHGIVDEPYHPLVGVTRHWALLRSTAKVLGPDLRVAVLAGDQVTLDRVRGRQCLGPGWVSHLLQWAVLHLWRTGAVDQEAVARSYGARREALLRALGERDVRAWGRGGMNVWVRVPDETAVVTRLMTAGWGVAPGARFRSDSPPGVRITVSDLALSEVGELADAVAEALRPERVGRYG
ncbi:aminotransferase class I/II-fold pyridoxal phosphate-dependent enzyme [Streptomyces sp. NPDC005438]|uniref:aminotransferase class I/II-fold pyridoxal phosphate-dependent enzyme n=1 Tax=Streptomyces sp. NPDC005438 TaxID=3156880 RepID=UPI0033B10638